MPLNALGLPFSYAFSSIFANRLFISLRCAYYNPLAEPGSELETDYLTSIQFKTNVVISDGSSFSTDKKSENSDEGLWV